MADLKQLTANDEKVLYEAGYLLLKRGKIRAAREVFEGLAAMTPQKGLPHTFLGNTYFAEMKFDEAIRLYRKALDLDSGSALAWAFLGEAQLASKQKEDGLTSLKKALSLDPNGASGKMAQSLMEAAQAGAF